MTRVFSPQRLPDSVVSYLREHVELDLWDGRKRPSREELIERSRLADGILMSGYAIDENLLTQLPNLKCVSTSSVGYDVFDTEAMRRHQVIGTHTPYVLDETVADLTFSLILATARRIVEMDTVVRNGNWGGHPADWYFGIDVHHRKLGIIGMGRIGEAVAKRAKFGFSMDVVYHNRSRKLDVEQTIGIQYVEQDELLETCDFVVLLTPLTEETRGMMNDRAFSLMKSDAIFINVSRGATVDEHALYEALKTNKIRAAGLDVFVKEPTPVTNPLLSLPNVVVVPHIGSATAQTRDDMAMLAATNIVAVLEGRYEDAHVIPESRAWLKEL